MIGASSHALTERENNDYYATDPNALKMLLELEDFKNVWEPACGGGHLAGVLEEAGILRKATDLVDRGYGETGIDFLKYEGNWLGDVITNPPYKYAKDFVEKSLDIIIPGSKTCMFLGIQFLESKQRKKFFLEYPPKVIYVSSSRIDCAKNGDFDKYEKKSARCYAWFIWEKGYKGDTILKWFN